MPCLKNNVSSIAFSIGEIYIKYILNTMFTLHTMAKRQLTQIYLDESQKTALQARAQANGVALAEEVRKAVDSYLAGVSSEELDMLDKASRFAETQLNAMATELAQTNKKLDNVFKQIHKIRNGEICK